MVDSSDATTPPVEQSHDPDAAIVASEEKGVAPVDEAQAPARASEASSAADIETLRRERDEFRDSLLRRRAEFENFRRRTERERQTWAAEAEATLVQELVPTLDNLEQALKATAAEGSLRDGVELVQRDLLGTLGRLGLAVHDPTGEPFNPLIDQALLHEETPDTPEGMVTETFRKGYLFKERLLRPALVKVAKAMSAGEADAGRQPPSSETVSNEVD
jgi:molecular chaperone GrpE